MKLNIASMIVEITIVAVGSVIADWKGAAIAAAAMLWGHISTDFGVPSIFDRDFWRGKNELNP